MRIAIAAPVSKRPEQGVTNIVYNTADALRARGHEVACLFLEDVAPGPGPIPRFQAIYFAARLAAHLARRRDEFDVVNIHAPSGLAYGLFRRVGWGSNLPPYVMLLHGLEERRNQAMRREAAQGRAPFRLKNRLWQYVYTMPLYRFAILTADHSVVSNRETWSMLQLRYGRDIARVWCVPNGVEPSFFVPRESPSAQRLLFVASWLHHKGIHYLRQGFEILAEQNKNLRLTIAGCGVEAQTVKTSFAASVRDQLDVLPFVSRRDMPDLYLRHDIFLFPSLMEGLPIALLEAMAGGLAVVTTETCGMMDVIEDGYNGLLVKPAQTGELVAAVERLLGSPELARRLGEAGRESARRYTWARVAEQLEKIFCLAASGA
ncbi:MAG TPA: glycosyltransferase family 4 protein [Gemmataceae bacterium]|nr:glycosyltransferase family 4 protein [Gemmataceae bacterium]